MTRPPAKQTPAKVIKLIESTQLKSAPQIILGHCVLVRRCHCCGQRNKKRLDWNREKVLLYFLLQYPVGSASRTSGEDVRQAAGMSDGDAKGSPRAPEFVALSFWLCSIRLLTGGSRLHGRLTYTAFVVLDALLSTLALFETPTFPIGQSHNARNLT